jgi:hypothetical protein
MYTHHCCRSYKIPQENGRKVQSVTATFIPHTGIQVAVHVAHEQYLTPPTNDDVSYVGMDRGLCGRLAMGPDRDSEMGEEQLTH